MTRKGVSRRELLQATGGSVVGAAFLIGSSSSRAAQSDETLPQSGTNVANSEGATDSKTEITLNRPYETVPTDVTFGWGGNAGSIRNYYDTHLGTMGYDGNYRFEGLADYSLDGKELTFEIRDDLTYHNGDPVTVMSFLWHQRQLYWVDPEGSGFSREHEMVDDHTAVYHYEEAPGSELLEIAYYSFHMSYPEPYELETNQMLKDASSSEERDEILNNRVSEPSKQDTLEHKVKEGHGSTGPYKIESWDNVTTESILMKRHDGHPYMDETSPEQLRLNFAGSQSARDQMITEDVTDFGDGPFPERLKPDAPSHLQTLVSFPIPRMRVVHFNYHNKDIGNRDVRRAILSAVDLPGVRGSTDDIVHPHTYQLGMTGALSDNFLGKEFVNNRIKYPIAANTDRASTYMEAAGYTKQKGSWIDPDGKKTDIVFVAKSEDADVANAVAGPLNDFGFNVTLQTEDNATYNSRVRNEFDYDMVLWSPHGCFNISPHPNCYYRVDKHTNLALGGGAAGAQDWQNATSLDDLEEGTHYVMEDGEAVSLKSGKPLFPTIPSEHGKERITGSGKEVNLLELDNNLKKDTFDPYVYQGAQYFNFDLPAFDLWENTSSAWGDTQGFSWPAEDNTDAWLLPSPIHSVIRKGQVQEAVCVARAVAGDDGTIGLSDIQTAINWWAEDKEVPGTGGETISLTKIQSLINAWAEDRTGACK